MQLVFQTDLLSKFNIHFFSRIINYFKGPLEIGKKIRALRIFSLIKYSI